VAGALTGPFLLASGVLAVAGIAKLRAPAGAAQALVTLSAGKLRHGRLTAALARLVGTLELGLGMLGLIGPSAVSGAAMAAIYAALAVAAMRLAAAGTDCGCFGAAPAPASRASAGFNLALAGAAALGAAWPPAGLGEVVTASPAGPALVLGLAGGVWAATLLHAALPAAVAAVGQDGAPMSRGHGAPDAGRVDALAVRWSAGLGSLLERRLSRRGALSRVAVAGTALAVAPVRYLVRPVDAWAVLRPGSCGSGLCTDGYTAFCCEIEAGRNSCPEGTYVAGWWKCTDYRGRGLCHGDGARYYLDCNRIPGHHFPGGCQCARGDCSRRRVDCNHFRYGQCNPQVPGTTEVVCRLVVCRNPAEIDGLNCNSTEMVDDNTCNHEAGCLEGLAVPLPGTGGV
jgi:hypothetical protein